MNSYTLNRDTKKAKGLLYTKMKIFHFKDKLDSLSPGTDKIDAPLHIRIKPTNRCNHNCSYCAYRVSNLQLGKDMSVRDEIPRDKMMEILDDIIEMGVKAITFSGGGEPFSYKHLAEAARKLSASPVKFAALTNGSLLDGEAAEIFAHNATWIRVSMDGWDDASYSGYRGVAKGEFGKVLNNLKNFKNKRGKCYLGVCIIVDKDNAPHIHELAGKLTDAGVNSIKFAPCIVSNSGKENNDYHTKITVRVKKEISRSIRDFKEKGVEIFDSYHGQLESFEKEYRWCPYLQILPVIGADLNIYPCQDKAYNLDEGLIGSIKDKRFKDFWFSGKEKFFRIDPSAHCNHHCVANDKNKLIFDYLNMDMEHSNFV